MMTPSRTDAWYRELFDGSLLGIYASRPDGSLTLCNLAFARMLGFHSIEEAMGIHPTAVQISPEQLERLQVQGRLVDARMRFRRRDGQLASVTATVVGVFDPSAGLIELRGFVTGATERDEQQSALEEREQQLHSVFHDAADAMLVLDDGRRVLDANRTAMALFGLPFDTLRSRRLDDLIDHDAGELAGAWRELLAIGEATRHHQVLSPSSGPRLVECSYRAAVGAGRHLCIVRDVTERRKFEERLVQSERGESVGRLAGGIAHDFNNLLTAILGYTELLLGSREADDPDRDDLEEIQKAGQRAAALTQQLLAYGRKQTLQPKDVDLNDAVLGVQGMLTRFVREDIALTYQLAPSPALVRIDPTQLEQVMLNLVLNARDAMPAGGSIRLDVARVRLDEVDLPSDHPVRAGEYVRLRVADNGVGLSPEARAHLFEPFFTTKEIGKGSGLGLAAVYGIVRQSGGFMSVESESGLGTAFTMHFPAVAPVPVSPVTNDESTATAAELSGGRELILLVEDEDAVRAIASAVLRRRGYQVLEASTPRAAVEIFQEHAPSIDLLVTDVVMPEMNGPALAQRLVAIRPELKVLFISGYAGAAFAVTEPNVSFLSKPFQASALASKVREVLSMRRTTA